MLRRSVFFALTISVCAFAAPFTLQQVMQTPFASELSVAPTGARVAWVVNSEGRRNVWTAAAPDWKGRQITSFNEDDGQEIQELAWLPDGKGLLFARGGDFETGRENPNPAVALHRPEQDIWLVRIDTRVVKELAPGHAPSVPPSGARVWFLRKGQLFSMNPDGSDVKSEIEVQGSASDLTWSPDGSGLAFTNHRGDHSFIAVYANNALHFLDPSVDSDSSPVWSRDGKQIAFLRIPASDTETIFAPRREGYPWSILIADAESGKAHRVFSAAPGPGSIFHGVVAGKQIMWTAGNHLVFPWEQTGWLHLYSVPVSGNTAAADLTSGHGEVEHVSFSADRKRIYFSSNIGDIDRRHLWEIAPDNEAQAHEITSGEGIEWQPEPIPGGNDVALLASGYNSSAHAEILTGEQRKYLAPDTVPADFPASSLVKPEPVIISAADGLQLHAQLFRPSGEGKHPALVFFHGGSRRQMLLGFHYMYYYSNAYAMNQYLASRGYLVLSVNYRSGIGYGLNFREALNYGAAGASEYNDVQGAGLYLKSREDVDSKRIGVWGGSYGGYLTALALARSSDLFAAGVDFHGVHDWNLEIPNFNPTYVPGAHPDFARIAYESSPIASIDTWRSPVLLIHGDDDRNVPFAETVHLVEALRKQRVYFEELIFPDEIHDFLLWRDWMKAYGAAADFFGRKLTGTAAANASPNAG